jgi:hypothetical protein
LDHSVIQRCGSVTFWYGSGSADPYHLLPDPDPAFSSVADKTNKNQFFAYYFLTDPDREKHGSYGSGSTTLLLSLLVSCFQDYVLPLIRNNSQTRCLQNVGIIRFILLKKYIFFLLSPIPLLTLLFLCSILNLLLSTWSLKATYLFTPLSASIEECPRASSPLLHIYLFVAVKEKNRLRFILGKYKLEPEAKFIVPMPETTLSPSEGLWVRLLVPFINSITGREAAIRLASVNDKTNHVEFAEK